MIRAIPGSHHVSVNWLPDPGTPEAELNKDYPKCRGVAEASFFFREPGEWYVNRVKVEPSEVRSKGAGKAMIDQLKVELVKLGCTRLIVEPGGYGADHGSQVRFYERQGFVPWVESEGAYIWVPSGDSRRS